MTMLQLRKAENMLNGYAMYMAVILMLLGCVWSSEAKDDSSYNRRVMASLVKELSLQRQEINVQKQEMRTMNEKIITTTESHRTMHEKLTTQVTRLTITSESQRLQLHAQQRQLNVITDENHQQQRQFNVLTDENHQLMNHLMEQQSELENHKAQLIILQNQVDATRNAKNDTLPIRSLSELMQLKEEPHVQPVARLNAETENNRFVSFGCVSEVISLACADDRTINVTGAYYGDFLFTCASECCVPHPTRDCQEYVPSSSTSEWIALKLTCDNTTSCEYQYRGATFINSCTVDSLADYMTIYYSCLPEDRDTAVGFTMKHDGSNIDYEGGNIVLFKIPVSNFGGHYQTESCLFICPFSGVYMFSVNILASPGFHMYGGLFIEGVRIAISLADENGNDFNQASNTVVVECQPGQRVWVECVSTGRIYGDMYSTFTGYLLHNYETV